MLLVQSLTPRIVHMMECPVCGGNMDLSPESLGWKVLHSNADPETKLLTLVAAGCCPWCGEQVVSDCQTPDDVIANYIEHVQQHR